MLGLQRGSGPYAPNELLVAFAPGTSASVRTAALSAIGARTIETIHTHAMSASGAGDLIRVAVGHGLDLERAAEIASKRPGVAYAEPNYLYTASYVTEDPYYTNGSLWGMYGDTAYSSQQNLKNNYGSQANEAWAANYVGSMKVGVGVIDTGIDYKHPDLYRNVWLNQTEIPKAVWDVFKTPGTTDIDNDGLITFRDLNSKVGGQLVYGSLVSDANRNGFIDAGDLLSDARWKDGIDGNGGSTKNGYVDDFIGWNFVAGNNNPFDDNKHGTHVSGTIAAYSDPSSTAEIGVVGVNWNAQIAALKFLDRNGSGSTANAVKALDYFTDTKAAYAKLGLGSDDFDFAATNNSWGGGGYSQTLLDAITRGAKADILFVAAAGNGGHNGRGDNNDVTANWPSNYNTDAESAFTFTQGGATYDAVIAVAAIDNVGSKPTWSNYGVQTVDLGAPGVGIYSTVPGGGYASLSGTSMATPHVTGAAALYSSWDPTATAAEIRAALLSAVEPTASMANRTVTGGRLDIGHLMPASPLSTTISDSNSFAESSGGWVI